MQNTYDSAAVARPLLSVSFQTGMQLPRLFVIGSIILKDFVLGDIRELDPNMSLLLLRNYLNTFNLSLLLN